MVCIFWVVVDIFCVMVGGGGYFLGGGTVYNSPKKKSRQNLNILRTKRASKVN